MTGGHRAIIFGFLPQSLKTIAGGRGIHYGVARGAGSGGDGRGPGAGPAGGVSAASCTGASRSARNNWLRPDAEASPERLFCHCYARGKGNGDPDILVVFDSGYDLTRHTFRFLKQVLGWTRSKLRDPAAADQWTWIVIACYAQLRLARSLAADLRLPWQQPCPPGRLTPARVRRGFRSIRQTLSDLASAPKPGKPGPGRPPGSKNSRPATRHDVGKTVKRTEPKKITRSQKG
jgi:hypothetical protein